MLDTGADVSVMTQVHWPKRWPISPTITELHGIGQSCSPMQSSQFFLWQDSEGHSGYFQPYVLPGLPLNLWGRDILKEMVVLLYSPNSQVSNMTLDQGFLPTKGLGTNQQGTVCPIDVKIKNDRQGLGFS